MGKILLAKRHWELPFLVIDQLTGVSRNFMMFTDIRALVNLVQSDFRREFLNLVQLNDIFGVFMQVIVQVKSREILAIIFFERADCF